MRDDLVTIGILHMYVRIGMALFGPIALMAARVVAEALQKGIS